MACRGLKMRLGSCNSQRHMVRNRHIPTLLLVFTMFCLGWSALSRPVIAATIRVSVGPSLWHCEAFGDPNCVNGRVSPFDPALAWEYRIDTNAIISTVLAASDSYTDPRLGTGNFTSGQVQARIGVLQATAAATVSSTPPLGSFSPNLMRLGSTAVGTFSDEITIVPADPLLAGLPGFFTGSFVVEGILNASQAGGVPGNYLPGMGNAWWQLFIMAGRTEARGDGYVWADGTGGGLGPAATVSITAPFVFGTPFQLSTTLDVKATATVSAAVAQPADQGVTIASANAVYFNTARWNGIQNVRAGTQMITNFTVVSASGANYTQRIDDPRLSITRAGSNVLISWPTNLHRYLLESASTVRPLTWAPLGSAVNTNDQYEIILPASDAARLFRLRQLP